MDVLNRIAETGHWIPAGITLGVFLVAALFVRLLWNPAARAVANRTGIDTGNTILSAPRSLITWGLVLLGINYSVVSLGALKSYPKWDLLLGKVLSIAWVALLLWTALRVFNSYVESRIRQAAENQERAAMARYSLNLFRKIINALVVGLAAIYILRIAGADISPLLASGAIGGLAIALAAKDTLTHLIAGFYLSIDRPIRVGDFVKIESGEEGYVEKIGWRNTTIRLFANNLVVIPNSKLSQDIITNYYMPEPAMSLNIPCGIAYGSDLEHVERTAIDVGAQLQKTIEGADPEWEPVVRWKTFGDSSINFITVLRVVQFEAQYLLQSEFIKALHKRFQEENIDIPFPMRTVILREPDTGRSAVGHTKQALPGTDA